MPPTTASQVAGGIAFVAAASLNIGQFAAQFTGIPALAPALGVVIAISQACAKIQSNKFVFYELGVVLSASHLVMPDPGRKRHSYRSDVGIFYWH
jgi:hypothetical protein